MLGEIWNQEGGQGLLLLVMTMERLAVLSKRDEQCYMEVRFVWRRYRDGGISRSNAQDRQSKQIQQPGAQCSWEFTEQTNLTYEVLNVTKNQTGYKKSGKNLSALRSKFNKRDFFCLFCAWSAEPSFWRTFKTRLLNEWNLGGGSCSYSCEFTFFESQFSHLKLEIITLS